VDRAQAEYLQQLVTHPGWLLFKEYARKEWGPQGYGRKMKAAIAGAKSLEDATQSVKAVDVASDEINALMSWPDDQVKHAQPAKTPEFSLQRGGA